MRENIFTQFLTGLQRFMNHKMTQKGFFLLFMDLVRDAQDEEKDDILTLLSWINDTSDLHSLDEIEKKYKDFFNTNCHNVFCELNKWK